MSSYVIQPNNSKISIYMFIQKHWRQSLYILAVTSNLSTTLDSDYFVSVKDTIIYNDLAFSCHKSC